jgi:rhodanese-related sulfurtransferase/rubrerythrin
MIQFKKLFTPVASMEAEEARAFMSKHREGDYVLLDVRQPGEYEEEHIPGAKLIPLPQLSDSFEELDRKKPVIVQCAVGGRSRVAAQMLSGYGFNEVYNLAGGIKAWQGGKATGPVELNLELVRGDESPGEMIELAYGMERSLQNFYNTLKEKAPDEGVKALFQQLADIEELHKKRLLQLLAEIDPGKERAALEMEKGSHRLEGGFDLAQFMEQNEAHLQSIAGVLEVAMMLETQALDLYLRFAGKCVNDLTKKVLYKISEEEKAHLRALGMLLEEKGKKEVRRADAGRF